MKKNKIFVACDSSNVTKIKEIISKTQNSKIKIGYKFGLEFLNSKNGRPFLSKFKNETIFADLKLHDIPNTVYKALKNIFSLGVWMTNIHLLGGTEMIQAAKEAQQESDKKNLLIGVTVLTSLNDNHLKEIGITENTKSLVSSLSQAAKEASLDGVVCSAHEVRKLKKDFGLDFLTVTPGIRVQQEKGDQTRVASLETAVKENTDYIVLGREISQAENIGKMINKLESYII